jgi:hypothetical protein
MSKMKKAVVGIFVLTIILITMGCSGTAPYSEREIEQMEARGVDRPVLFFRTF